MQKKSKCNIREPHSHLVHGQTFECEKGQPHLPPQQYGDSTTDEGKDTDKFIDCLGDMPKEVSAAKSRGDRFAPESWEEEFEIQCDYIFNHAYGQANKKAVKLFISQTLATEKAKWMKEWREKNTKVIASSFDQLLNGVFRLKQNVLYYDWRTIEEILPMIDSLKKFLLTTPSEQEER